MVWRWRITLFELQLVSTQSLARLFKLFKDKVECVLLNACYSEEQALAIHQNIDCVIGMSQAVGDASAESRFLGDRYLQRHILKGLGHPLVLAMDEVDRVFDTSFRNDFFGMLRSRGSRTELRPGAN